MDEDEDKEEGVERIERRKEGGNQRETPHHMHVEIHVVGYIICTLTCKMIYTRTMSNNIL